ncbi:MAG: hypothetical protein HC866_18385 [Leptolyngbyaceae cyanobacterium RU_5_1]|nr:hypothetical protein [Leptolyngbyaceae cyanobacterium RU_5_1]
MKLPNYENAIVPQAKVTNYLLSLTHPDGSSKARFFIRFGFSANSWEVLASALYNHAAAHEVVKVEASPFGTRYVIEGKLITPDHRNPMIRAVWFIGNEEAIPRFATAYPLEVKENDNDPGI